MVRKPTLGGRVFDIFNYSFLALVTIVTIIPFIHIFVGSFTASEELAKGGLVLFPTKPSLDAYKYIFTTSTFVTSLLVTIRLTIIGTLFNVAITSLMAYSLAHERLLGRRTILALVVFTIIFNGGMIPTFLVVKMFGLLDKFWALVLPNAIGALNLILMKNFFQQIPKELEESARIDGANDPTILFRIVIPLSLPAIATFSLFYAVNYWNTFLSAILYINDTTKWPIQVLLRQIVVSSQRGFGDMSMMEDSSHLFIPPQSIKMAVIIVSTIPILLVYPFLQKHFTKGVMLGSVKG